MHPLPPAEPPGSHPPPLVLDTNVLLDWLLFQDPSTRALDLAVRSGRWQWAATEAMRAELEQVLTRDHLSSRQTDLRVVPTAWARWAWIVEPARVATQAAMRCSDPDDQMFIDLALQLGAVLLSRDRAVLSLARAGRARGIQIMTPAAWATFNAEALPPVSGG
jgi:predicted nucleic acid-binding protein